MDSGFLSYAARKYEEMNEGVTVVINEYMAATTVTAEDGTVHGSFDPEGIPKYAQTINTALMSGRAEDIIDVSVLSWVSLADGGYLLDLEEGLALGYEDYYRSITNAYSYMDAQYAVPLCFSFTGYRLGEALAEEDIPVMLTLDDLVQLSEKYPYPVYSINEDGQYAVFLAEMFFGMDIFKYIDLNAKEAHLDDGKFQTLLEKVKLIADNAEKAQREETKILHEVAIFSAALNQRGIEDYTGVFILTNDDGLGLFRPGGAIPAVNANSENKELALDFIRFMLSEEIQSSPELLYNPVNRKASAEFASQVLAKTEAAEGIPEGFDLEANLVMFNNLAESLGVVSYSDSTLREFVRDELALYFYGEVTAEQAAANLQTTLNTYLKE
jgi:multiple sugar transport system substrate-binding protein